MALACHILYCSRDLPILASIIPGIEREQPDFWNIVFKTSVSSIFPTRIKDQSHVKKIEAQSADIYWILTTHDVKNCYHLANKKMEAREAKWFLLLH